jgi:hypothetical protein
MEKIERKEEIRMDLHCGRGEEKYRGVSGGWWVPAALVRVVFPPETKEPPLVSGRNTTRD